MLRFFPGPSLLQVATLKLCSEWSGLAIRDSNKINFHVHEGYILHSDVAMAGMGLLQFK